MREYVLMTIAVFAGLLGAAAQAQTPAPAPTPVSDAIPFDIPFGMSITIERAKKVAEAAIAEAKRRNWKMAVAIVNPSGDLVYFEKLDDTQLAASEIAPAKAKSAALYRRPTKVFMDLLESGHTYVLTLKGMNGAEGGIPLVENGKLIGAIGAAGGAAVQDGLIAKAGADTLK
jgi:glc operon protein GlcG